MHGIGSRQYIHVELRIQWMKLKYLFQNDVHR